MTSQACSRQIEVLLVEDSPTDALLLRAALEADLLSSFIITGAERLREGLAELQRTPGFDVALLDLGLPDSQGLETFTQIHRLAPDLPVIVFSGNADEADAVAAVRGGAQDYLVKGPTAWETAGRAIRYAVERQRTQAQLRASERYWRTLLEQSHDGIEVLSGEGVILYGSPAAMRIFGYPPEELVGHSALALIYPPDLPAASQDLARILASPGQPIHTLTRFVRKDGELCWIEGTSTNRLDDPDLRGIVINYRDVTKRILAEHALRESQEHFATVFHTNPVSQSIVTWDAGKIIEVNEACCRLFGYSREELLGATTAELNLWAEPAERQAALAELQHSGHLALREAITRVKSGEQRAIVAAMEPITWKGRPCVLSLAIDVTERKQAEVLMYAQRDLARIISAGLLPREAWERCFDVLLQATGLDSGGIYLLEAETSAVKLVYQRGLSPDFVRTVANYPADAPNAQLAMSDRAIYFDAAEIEERDLPREEGLRSLASIPLVSQGRIIGRLNVASHSLASLPEVSRRTLETLSAEIGSIAIYLRAEADLLQREEQQRLILDHLPVAVVLADLAGNAHYQNSWFFELFGFPAEQVSTLAAWSTLVFPDPTYRENVVSEWNRRLAAAQETGCEVAPMEMVATCSNGIEKYIRATGRSISDLFFITLTDITERKKAEALLEARVQERTAEIAAIRRRLELAITVAGLGIWDWDIKENRWMWDDQTYALYGRSRNGFDVSLKTLNECVHPDDITGQLKLMAEALQNRRIYESEYRVIWPDGSIHYLRTSAMVLFDTEGQAERLIGLSYDITAAKEAEEQLRLSGESLRTTNLELQRAARVKDEFLTSMSHELRTPLTGVLGLSEALRHNTYGPLNEKQLNALATIEKSGQHLLDLINDILDIARLDAGKLEIQVQPCGLDEICQASLQLIRGMAQKKRQVVRFAMEPAMISVTGDARRLKQILVNLLGNAIKFTPERGVLGLEVTGDPEAGAVRLSVWDHGIGVASEHLAQLFDPFVQLDSSLARQYEGSGLGLPLVKRLTELHGGHVEVESVLGQGSRFTVVLPWTPADRRAEGGARQNPARRRGPELLPGAAQWAATVMLVEDNADTLDVMIDYLEAHNFGVVPVDSGPEFLRRVAEVRPDIVLIDIQMPGMDGLTAIEHLRADADARLAATPVIAVTALAMPGDRERCLAAGASEYLSKPFHLHVMVGLISKVLDDER